MPCVIFSRCRQFNDVLSVNIENVRVNSGHLNSRSEKLEGSWGAWISGKVDPAQAGSKSMREQYMYIYIYIYMYMAVSILWPLY